jgi:hypothetical protein
MMGAGTVAAMLYNVNRGKDDKAVTLMDFVPNYKKTWEEKQAELDDEERIASMKALFNTVGPTVH